MSSKIGWTDQTWSPVTGCTPVSLACDHCWAKRMAQRLKGRYGYPADEPFRVTLHPERLDEPLRWRKPRRVFVVSMGDLFHEDVPFDYIARVWDAMFDAPQHTFQVLTKRPERMREFVRWLGDPGLRRGDYPNVWLGVTAEDQRRADKRIPILLDIPAAMRFVSCEPLLGAVSFRHKRNWNYQSGSWLSPMDAGNLPNLPRIDWVIVGGETGPGSRPTDLNWIRDLRWECHQYGVPFYLKDHPGTIDGQEHREFPGGGER